MAIQLNHTIVPARDAHASATFLTEILALAPPVRFGPFWAVALENGVTLDFQDSDEAMPIEHYAFLVSESEFDAIFERIRARGLDYWADPAHQRKSEINRNDGGRGVYWNDPNGHYLEIITRPYGSGA
jgi:catechol 2,3-dioxygenase-like lactoylglutathione lyase family enzyme